MKRNVKKSMVRRLSEHFRRTKARRKEIAEYRARQEKEGFKQWIEHLSKS